MKKYEKPIVMINEELAEGVYAASGIAESENGCWVLNCVIPQQDDNTITSNNGVQVKIQTTHTNPEKHLSAAEVVITFNQPITSVLENSALVVTCDGSKVVKIAIDLTTYNEGPEYKEFNITVQCASMSTLQLESATIECTGD